MVESLRLDYAQFLELELFTRFGAVLDPRVQARIARGERIRAALVQPQFAPMSLAMQVAVLLALQRGALDALPVDRIGAFRAALPGWLAASPGRSLVEASRAAMVADDAQLDEWAASLATLAASVQQPAASSP